MVGYAHHTDDLHHTDRLKQLMSITRRPSWYRHQLFDCNSVHTLILSNTEKMYTNVTPKYYEPVVLIVNIAWFTSLSQEEGNLTSLATY